ASHSARGATGRAQASCEGPWLIGGSGAERPSASLARADGVQAHERIEDQQGGRSWATANCSWGALKPCPPEPPSFARQTWRATRGAVGVASIPLMGRRATQPRYPLRHPCTEIRRR